MLFNIKVMFAETTHNPGRGMQIAETTLNPGKGRQMAETTYNPGGGGPDGRDNRQPRKRVAGCQKQPTTWEEVGQMTETAHNPETGGQMAMTTHYPRGWG